MALLSQYDSNSTFDDYYLIAAYADWNMVHNFYDHLKGQSATRRGGTEKVVGID